MNPNLPGLTLCEELKQNTATALTGTTSETVLATLHLPGGTLGANGEIEIDAVFTETNNANAKTVQFRLGGLTGTSVYSFNTNTIAGRRCRGKSRLRNSAASQSNTGESQTVASTLLIAHATSTVNLQLDQDIVITGTLAVGGDTLQLESATIRCYKG